MVIFHQELKTVSKFGLIITTKLQIGNLSPVDIIKCVFAHFLIIRRFESTIRAQFFGHTHADEFEIFYDDDDPGIHPFVNYGALAENEVIMPTY